MVSLLFVSQSDSLQPHGFAAHGLPHARLPHPSPSPGDCSNSCPSSWWCHQTISSSVIPFSFCPQSFPKSGFFPTSQFFTSGVQNIVASASASVLPMNIQNWFPLGLTGLILQFKGPSRVFSNATVQKHQFFSAQHSLWFNSYIQTWLPKTHSFDYRTFVSRIMSLFFNTLSRFVIAFLPRIKYLLISWLQSLSAVVLEPPKIESVTVSTVSSSTCHEWWDQMA